MPNRPQPQQSKNKVDTMQRIIDAVGSILKVEGHHGLKVNKIAARAKRNRTLINRYFDGLEGLQRAFVMEKDYWMPFFKRFVLAEADGLDVVKATFIAVMQENLRFFIANQEMQNIILWQISEHNPIVSEISHSRERQGDRLYEIAEPYFRNTGVNFRAVTGLILGGIYFMVLQARTGNSPVCGIDLNSDLDQVEVQQAIRQIITWACEATDKNETIFESLPMLNHQCERLDKLVVQLSEQSTRSAIPNVALQNELRDIKRVIRNQVVQLANESKVQAHLRNVIVKLGEIASDLDAAGGKVNPNSRMVVTEIIALLRHFYDQVPDGLLLPPVVCAGKSADYRQRWQKIKLQLDSLGFDPFLIDATYHPYGRMGSNAQIYWYDFKYLKIFTDTIETELNGIKTEQDLRELLVGLGYNASQFTARYTKALQARLRDTEGSERISLLQKEITTIQQVISRTGKRFDPEKMPVGEELIQWITIEIRKAEGLVFNGEDGYVEKSLNTTLNLPELACWQKLQYDAGLYKEANIDVFTNKVGTNFKTRSGTRPSGGSVKSKIYTKDRKVYQALRPIVEKIKADIDRFLM